MESELRSFGWWFDRHGSKHDIWTNGRETEAVPRHNEINEYTAKKILRTADFREPNLDLSRNWRRA